MSHTLGAYLREQRHIFGVCPNSDCRHISRLAELQVSYVIRYIPDWLDQIQSRTSNWEEKINDYQERKEEVRKEYRQKAMQTILPRKIRKIFPLFRRQRVDPIDVRVLSHPVDFVAFDGMGAGDLKRIVLLDQKEKTKIRGKLQKKVNSAIDRGDYDLHILRVDAKGTVTTE